VSYYKYIIMAASKLSKGSGSKTGIPMRSAMTLLLDTWDKSPTGERLRLAAEFVSQYGSNPETDLEAAVGPAASLLLIRLIIFLQFSFVEITRLEVILQAIKLFFSSPWKPRYVSIFISADGIHTCLSLITDERVDSEDKLLATSVLQDVLEGGRRFKETFCEVQGTEVCCSIVMADPEFAQPVLKLLENLLADNPRFNTFVFISLFSLLPSAHHIQSQLSRILVKALQGGVKPEIEEQHSATLSALVTSNNLRFKSVACQLASLLDYTPAWAGLVTELVEALKQLTSQTVLGQEGQQQTQAVQIISAIRMLSNESQPITKAFIKAGVLRPLLRCIGDVSNRKCQHEALVTVQEMCKMDCSITFWLKGSLPTNLYDVLQAPARSIHGRISPADGVLLYSLTQVVLQSE